VPNRRQRKVVLSKGILRFPQPFTPGPGFSFDRFLHREFYCSVMIKKENRISYIRSVPAKVLIMALSLGSVGCGFLGPSDSDDDLLPLAGLLALAGAQQAQFDCTDDGLVWTEPTIPEANAWTGITYGNGLYVAVANDGTNRIMTSTDARNWTVRSAPGAAVPWYDVAYGDNLFVAVAGANGAEDVMTSSDGVNWTRRSEPVTADFRRIEFGGGRFVAAAESTANLLVTADGVSNSSVTPSGTIAAYNNVSYVNDKFLIFDQSSGSSIRSFTSTDGNSWTERTVPSGLWTSSAYGSGRVVAVGFGGSGGDTLMYSPNGIDGWVLANDPATFPSYRAVAHGGGLFVAVNHNGSPEVIISTDGINWTGVAEPTTRSWINVAYGNGKFVAVAESGQIMVSECD